jgi:tetratricopeptide (TPR) repeat protein
MKKRHRRPRSGRSARARRPAEDPPAPPDRLVAVEQWLAHRQWWVLAAIVAASLGLRAAYFLQLRASPLLDLHRWNQSDMNYFDAWGRRIAEGDWLSATIGMPLHGWQQEVAEQYLSAHAGERATLVQEVASSGQGEDENVDAALWTRWLGEHRFYQDPLYPYLIGLTYHVVGRRVRFVFGWQMLLGVMSVATIWLLARRFFDELVAACAAALAVLCAPLMMYELLLLRETTIVFVGLAIIWLADRALVSRRGWWFALLGAACGAAFLLKSSLLLLAGGVSLGVLVVYRHRWREVWKPAVAGAAGFAIVVAPLVLRNRSLGLPPLALASGGGLDFILSNDVTTDPALGFGFDVRRIADLMSDSGGALVPAIRETLKTHSLASYARLLWGKWQAAWYWFEIPNNANFYYWRLRAPVLAWLPVTFWLCAPLGLVGLVLGARSLSRLWLLYLLVACSLAPLLVFYVLSRFRLPLLAALIPFAALTLVTLARWIGQRRYRPALAAAGAVAIAAVWTGRPLHGQPLIRPSDWLTPYVVRYEPQAKAALDAHDPAGAAAAYLAFFRYEPDAGQLAATSQDLVLALGEMHADCATYLREAGQARGAQAQLNRAGTLFLSVLTTDPANLPAHLLFGNALFAGGSFAEAVTHYNAYLRRQPNDATALARFGVSLAATNHPDEALQALRRAVVVDAGNEEAQQDLANGLLDHNLVDEGADHAARAVALAPNEAAAHDALGRARALQGRRDDAAAEFEEALRLDPRYAPAREHLSRVQR